MDKIFWPWLVYDSITHIRNILSSQMRVFEFGSGSSTIFYALRCREVVVVDHDAEWAARVQEKLDELGITNVNLTVIPADEGSRELVPGTKLLDPENYYSNGWKGHYEQYTKTIDQYEDGEFHVISVDGAARPSCIVHAYPKLKAGGMFILDNAERPRYQSGINHLPKDWSRTDFVGDGSVHAWRAAVGDEKRTKKWQTTVWRAS